MSKKCKSCYYDLGIYCENCIENPTLKNKFVQRFDYLPTEIEERTKYNSLSALFESVALLHEGKFKAHNLVIGNKVREDGLNELRTFIYGNKEFEEPILVGYVDLYGVGEELEKKIKDKYVFPVVRVE